MGGASVLPQNLHLGFEVEVAGYMSRIVSNSELCCDPCIDGRSGPAEVFCCTCYVHVESLSGEVNRGDGERGTVGDGDS